MPLRSDWSERACPIARSLDVVGDPWVLLIVREALLGTRRFDQFRDTLEIADNVLSRRLQAMVEAGLLDRRPYRDGNRTRQEYALTDMGEDLLPVLQGLVLWGERHRGRDPELGRFGIIHRVCGEFSESPDRCSACGGELSADVVDWHRPWRDPAVTPLVPADGPEEQVQDTQKAPA